MTRYKSRSDGDAPLTTLGLEQAELLGRFYAPVLEEKAREGKLHLWTSPQMRTMQSAHPLYARLFKETGITANIRPELHEHGPPQTENMRVTFYSQGDELRRKLNRESKKGIRPMKPAEVDAEVDSFLRSHTDEWDSTGMTPRIMQSHFPWCEPPSALGDDEKWYETRIVCETVRVHA